MIKLIQWIERSWDVVSKDCANNLNLCREDIGSKKVALIVLDLRRTWAVKTMTWVAWVAVNGRHSKHQTCGWSRAVKRKGKHSAWGIFKFNCLWYLELKVLQKNTHYISTQFFGFFLFWGPKRIANLWGLCDSIHLWAESWRLGPHKSSNNYPISLIWNIII